MLSVSILATAMTIAGTCAVFSVISLLAGGKLVPQLPAVDPNTKATWRDQFAYYAANTVALTAGAALAVALYFATPPIEAPLRYDGFYFVSRIFGPFIFGVSMGCYFLRWTLVWTVRPQQLVHILHRVNRRYGGADLRGLLAPVGLVFATFSLFLHFGIREVHMTLEEQGVVWIDWPWQDERRMPWSDLADIRIVRTSSVARGAAVAHGYLEFEFSGDVEVVCGSQCSRPVPFWETPANYASERSGVAIRYVDK